MCWKLESSRKMFYPIIKSFAQAEYGHFQVPMTRTCGRFTFRKNGQVENDEIWHFSKKNNIYS